MTIQGRLDRALSGIGAILRCFGAALMDLGTGNYSAGTANFWGRNSEFLGKNRELLSIDQVSAEFSHACSGRADCDLTSMARYAEEDSISVEMAGGLSGGA